MKSLKIATSILTAILPLIVCSEPVVIVNPKNPLSALAAEQVEWLFLSKRADFPGGGIAKPVNLPEGNRLRDEFYEKASRKDVAQLKSYWARLIFTGKALPPKELASEADIKKYVSSTPEGIGYVNKESIDNTVKAVATIR
ncbi:MAG: phosphate ABC transporter substrate-binding protein [Pseudomonadota bacterium]